MTEQHLATDDMPVSDTGSLLKIEGVAKRFGGVIAVDQLSLDIKAGEFFALLGPSGCGKTTLLRMLAGFETPDAGRILLDGEDIASVLPHRRPVNMMFQNYALFPHLDVHDNIAFGLKRAGLPRAEIKSRVAEMLALARLEGFGRRRPHQLSGGQQQRVALARALARRPRLLLLDEPLAALDKKLREDTQRELIELQRNLGTSFVIVTHDQDEAMTLADRIGVMNDGRLVQVATPRQLYEAPASRWVAEFVGDVNILEGVVERREDHRWIMASHGIGPIAAAAPRLSPAGEAVCVAIRPEKIKLSRRGPVDAAIEAGKINHLDGTVSALGYLGGSTNYTVKLDGGGTLMATLANAARVEIDEFSAGDHVVAWFEPDDCVVLAA